MPVEVIFATGAGVFVLIAIVLAVHSIRANKQRLREASSDLGAREGSAGDTWRAAVDGIAYEYAWRPGGNNQPSVLALEVACPTGGTLKINRENTFDRLFKRLGIAVEVQTGSTAFDDQFYIAAADAGFAGRMLADPSRQQGIRALFDLGFTRVTLDDRKMKAVRSPCALEVLEDTPAIENAVRALGDVAKAPPGPRSAVSSAQGGVRRFVGHTITAVVAICAVAALVGGLIWYDPIDGGRLLLASAPWALGGWLIAAMLLLRLYRGSSSSHREFLVSIVIVTFSAPCLAYGGFAVVNGHLDASPVMEHTALVVDKRISRSDRSTSYYLRVQSWRPGRDIESLNVTRAAHDRARKAETRVSVNSRQGRLGYEWIVRYHVPH